MRMMERIKRRFRERRGQEIERLKEENRRLREELEATRAENELFKVLQAPDKEPI